MLILEGAGRLGKSTAASRLNELAIQRGWTWVQKRKMNKPGPDFDWRYQNLIEPEIIQDRFHLGGLAYHHQDETQLDEIRVQIINSWIHATGGIIVLFYTDNMAFYGKQFSAFRHENKPDNMDHYILQQSANYKFTDMQRYADHVVRVNSVDDFPTDDTLNFWLDEWAIRRGFALE